MVSGDTPERPVMDSIIKVRWQTHVTCLIVFGGGGGGVHVLTISTGSGQNRHQ